MKFSGVCGVCVCCPLLLLLWPQTTAGSVLGYTGMMRSTENLLEALYKVREEINKTDNLRPLLPSNCSVGVAPLKQAAIVLHNLTASCCLWQLQAPLPHFKKNLSHLVNLSQDLLRHMSNQEPASCSSSLSLEYDDVLRSVKCVSCWIHQVEMVNSALTHSASSKRHTTQPHTL